VVGGAAAVLTRFRALALATVMTALAVWGAVAEHLPAFKEWKAITIAAVLVLPAFTVAIWLALPLARYRATGLLIAAAVAGSAWVFFYFIDFEIASNISKLTCFVLVGFWFLSLFEFLWWVALVALFVPWVDIWSVAAGPTRYVTEEQPQFFDSVAVALHVPGQTATAGIGPPDIVFFALFLATAQLYRLRVAWTWICMTGFLGLTLVLVWAFDSSGLPALPAVCFGFLVPNADLIWRDVRDAYAAYIAKRGEAK
jgi:hypothetical protein